VQKRFVVYDNYAGINALDNLIENIIVLNHFVLYRNAFVGDGGVHNFAKFFRA